MRFSRILPFVAVFAHFSAWSVEISDGWMRAMPPGQPTAAAYVTLLNDGAEPLQLVGGSSTAAESVEIHESSQVDGMWRMRRLQALELPPGETVTLSPGGIHLMLFGMQRPLREGDILKLSLQFDSGETREVVIDVRATGGTSHHHH